MHLRENNQQVPRVLEHASHGEEAAYQTYVKAGEYLFRKHSDITTPANLLDEALNEFSRALEIRPDSAEVQGRMACLFVRKGDYKKGETYAVRALNNDPKQPEALYALGYIAYKSEAPEESLHYLHDAIRHGGLNTSRYRFCLAYAYNALAQKTSGIKGFWRTVQTAYYVMTGIPFVGLESGRLNLGNLAHIVPVVIRAYAKENNHDLDGALEDLLKLYEKYPGLPSIQNMIGALYHNKGLHEESSYWYRKAIHRDPLNEEGHLQLARILEENGIYDVAFEMYQKLLVLKPNSPELYCSLGNVLYMMGRFEETVHHYRTALQLSDDNAWKALLAQSISKIYQDQMPNREAAQASLQMAVELNPDDVDNYIHLGVIHFETEDYMSAEKLYMQALKIAPEHPQLYSSLGYLKWMAGEIEDAVVLYDKAIDLDPFYDIPHNNLGVIYLDTLGDVQKAIGLFERAITLNENYALAYYNLGRAHSFLNNKLEAASCFRKAQEVNDFTRELDNAELEDRIFKLFNTSENP